jgi:hypothetical protein
MALCTFSLARAWIVVMTEERITAQFEHHIPKCQNFSSLKSSDQVPDIEEIIMITPIIYERTLHVGHKIIHVIANIFSN